MYCWAAGVHVAALGHLGEWMILPSAVALGVWTIINPAAFLRFFIKLAVPFVENKHAGAPLR